MKVGLVLEGGAMRGMYTAGILDELMEKNIKVNGVIGVSAGALFGTNILSKQEERVIRYSKRFNCDWHYMGLMPLIREGNVISRDYAYYRVPMEMDVFDEETFEENAAKIPFYAVLTQVENGRPYYARIRKGFAQMETLRASSSMPFVSRPVKIGAHHYLDGGISDSIPFQWMAKNGYDRLIVVLTRDLTYRKKPMSPFLIHRFYRKYPALQSRLISRHKTYNDSVELLSKWEKEGRAFVFRPSKPIEIGRMESDPSKLQAVYELGLEDGEAKMEELKAYLS